MRSHSPISRRDDASTTTEAASSAIATALLAPVLVGDCVQLLLYGILLSAVYSFCTSSTFSRTSTPSKIIIAAVVVLTSCYTALNFSDILHCGTLQARDESSLLMGTMVEAIEPLLVGIIGALVESILVLRAAKMFESGISKAVFVSLAALAIFAALLGSIGATIWGVLYFYKPYLDSPFTPTFNQCVVVWLASSAGADCAITAAFIYQLRKHVKPTGFNSSTTSALRLIISLAVQSAALTAIVALAGAILSVAYTGNDLMTTDIAYAFWIPLPGLYALSLFTTLSVSGRVERRLRGVSTAFSFTRSSGVDKATTAVLAHSPPEAGPSAVDGVSVHVELWVKEEVVELETEEGDQSDEDGVGIERGAGPARRMDVAPGHLCPQ